MYLKGNNKSSYNGRFKFSGNERRTTKQVVEWIKFIRDTKLDYMVTLTFKYPVNDYAKVSSYVKRFLNHLNESAFGRKSNKRINAFPVAEKGADDNYHVHILIEDPIDRINPCRKDSFDLRDQIIIGWLNSSAKAGNPATSGTPDWFKPIDDIQGAIEYLTKQINYQNNSSPILIEHICRDGRKSTIH